LLNRIVLLAQPCDRLLKVDLLQRGVNRCSHMHGDMRARLRDCSPRFDTRQFARRRNGTRHLNAGLRLRRDRRLGFLTAHRFGRRPSLYSERCHDRHRGVGQTGPHFAMEK
jgi:hypothetical protein